MSDKKNLAVYLPPTGYAKLEALARQVDLPLTDLVRTALAEYAQAHGATITVDDLRLGQWGGTRRRERTTRNGGRHGPNKADSD